MVFIEMSKRDDLFRSFGPLLLEAFMRITLEETNRLRAKLNMPQITDENVMSQIDKKLSEQTPYGWMTNGNPL
jgi:hypothetical protein